MFIQVGVIHLDVFTYMIEGWLPQPKALIIISGLTEIILGIGYSSLKSSKNSIQPEHQHLGKEASVKVKTKKLV